MLQFWILNISTDRAIAESMCFEVSVTIIGTFDRKLEWHNIEYSLVRLDVKLLNYYSKVIVS